MKPNEFKIQGNRGIVYSTHSHDSTLCTNDWGKHPEGSTKISLGQKVMVGNLARSIVGWCGAEELNKLSSPTVVGLGQGHIFCEFAVVTFIPQVTRILPSLLDWSWRSTAKLPGYPCPLQGAWNEIIFDFPPNPNQPMVLSEGNWGFEGKKSKLAGGAAVLPWHREVDLVPAAAGSSEGVISTTFLCQALLASPAVTWLFAGTGCETSDGESWAQGPWCFFVTILKQVPPCYLCAPAWGRGCTVCRVVQKVTENQLHRKNLHFSVCRKVRQIVTGVELPPGK